MTIVILLQISETGPSDRSSQSSRAVRMSAAQRNVNRTAPRMMPRLGICRLSLSSHWRGKDRIDALRAGVVVVEAGCVVGELDQSGHACRLQGGFA